VSAIQLIVGLGNPGRDYAETRHNAGAWFVEALAKQQNCTLQNESKFFGLTGRINIASHDVKLLIPTTFMNLSGQAVAALATFFKIPLDAMLIAHDELDIAVGEARFKQGGGHGGHNGLRDIISKFGNQNNFHRLRIGIGHPGSADKVTGYVLNKPQHNERIAIDATIDAALKALPLSLSGQWSRAMNQLHAFKTEP
jgi:peptidyl-tRNA hydrolase, PTH1 family